jgi:protein-disulfide isomerase
VPIDVDSTTGGQLAARMNITATPTLVVMGAELEAARLVGVHSLTDLRRTLEQAWGIACATTSRPDPSG